MDKLTSTDIVLISIGLLLVICIYFAPTCTAMKRGVECRSTIMVINFLFGWTLLGWLICFLIAFFSESEEEIRLKNQQLQLQRQQFMIMQSMANQMNNQMRNQYNNTNGNLMSNPMLNSINSPINNQMFREINEYEQHKFNDAKK